MDFITKNKSLIIKILSSIIGVVFLISAIFKLIDIKHFISLISEYNIDLFVYLIPFLIILEIFIGIELFLNINIKRNTILASVFLFFVTLIYAYGYSVKGIEDCGCFGNSIQMSAVFVFIRNIILIVFSLLLFKYSKPKKANKMLQGIAMFILGFGVFFTGNYFTLPAHLGHKNINKHELQDASILKTEFGTAYNFDKDSTYIVFAFSYTCPHCINSIENAKQYNKMAGIDKTLFFIIGDENSKAEFYRYFTFDSLTTVIENRFTSKTISSLPTTLVIKNNKVNQIFVGELPSNLIFEKKILN